MSLTTFKRSKTLSVMLIKDALRFNTSILQAVVAAPNVIFKLGIGKSVYALKTLYYIYGKWNVAKRYVVFMPEEFLRLFEELIDQRARLPVMLWDDAGFWLGRQRWLNKFVIAVREHLNVIRTHVGSIMFTAPRLGELAKGIRDNIDVAVLVRIHRFHEDPHERVSYYRVYAGMTDDTIFDRSKSIELIGDGYFRHYFEYYKDYEVRRKDLVRIGYLRAKEKLKEIAAEAAEALSEIASKHEEGRKPEPIIEPDEIDVEDLDELREVWGYG